MQVSSMYDFLQLEKNRCFKNTMIFLKLEK